MNIIKKLADGQSKAKIRQIIVLSGGHITKSEVDALVEAHAHAAVEAAANVSRGTTFTRVALLGVAGLGSKKVKGDLYVTFTVDGEIVKEVVVAAKHQTEAHAWAIAFNAAAKA